MKTSFFKTLKKTFIRYQWLFIGLLIAIWFFLGYYGIEDYYFKNPANGVTRFDYVYLSIQMFALQLGEMPGHKNWQFEIARFGSPVVSALAFLLAMAHIFYQQINSLRLYIIKNHVIICGLGEKGSLLAEGFLNDGNSVVIIEPDPNNEFVEGCIEEGAIVLRECANDEHTLKRVRPLDAKYLIATSETME